MITSTSNGQVKYLIQLQNRAKIRKEEKKFVVEGWKMVEEVPSDRLVKVFVSESFKNNNEINVNNIKSNCEIVSDHVFQQISDTKTPQGILAVVDMMKYSIEDFFVETPFIALIENLQDPGNLGTIIRTAEAAGVTGILLSPNTVDIYNPKTIRSTMGSLFRVPFVYEDDFYESVEYIRTKKVTVYASHLDGKQEYTGCSYKNGTAFLIGNEGNGLTDRALQHADTLIKIPMSGKTESLNASIAAGILFYELKRQRSQS